jgi:ABC-type molybdate transport system substrate-binding protein
MTPLQVAYAGSMGSMMDGGIRPAIAKALGAELQGRAQGSTGLANLIVAGSIRPDVFISVTPGPMRVVLKAGKAQSGTPIARTEMVIAYSPKSQYAASLAKSGDSGAKPWWQILETPGFRFGRTDPNTDPQGLNIIFTMQLAARYYHQLGLAERVLGPQTNPQQIFQEPQVMARLQAGQLDASSAYKTQPQSLDLPFISLPAEINLGSASVFPNLCGSDHRDHAPAQHIVAAELKLHSCGAEISGHAPERITQAVGRLRPAHRAAHRVADHGVEPRMKFRDRPGKALTGQLGQRPIERGGLEGEVACLGAIGLAGRHRLSRLHT